MGRGERPLEAGGLQQHHGERQQRRAANRLDQRFEAMRAQVHQTTISMHDVRSPFDHHLNFEDYEALPRSALHTPSTMARGAPRFGAFSFGVEDELLRRVMSQSFEDDVPQVERASNRDIASLPVHCLTAEEVASATDDQKSCTICMEDFKAGDEQKTLPCFHKLHAQCVDQWLQRSVCCPVCKHGV